MVNYTCDNCNYISTKKTDYARHLITKKHIQKLTKDKSNDKQPENQTKINNKDIIVESLEELKNKIEQLEKTNNQNTHTIVKEARTIKKSLLSILNSNFKDTPSIDYIDEDDFITHLEDEYNLKIDTKDNKIFMRIFSDFEKKKLIHSMSKVILRFLKKEDQKSQSVFNIDAARGNYATKIQDIWHNDKKGLQMKKYTIDMMMKYMLNVMDIYRLRLLDMYNENKVKKDINITDYIMEKQGLLLNVNAFLTSPITHKKIVLYMCSELRMDDKLLLNMYDE
jgi:hypothetical protein